MTEYSGRGDPTRSLELLWGTREPPTRGPRPGIGVRRIVRAAVEVADAEGLGALSMRRVAQQLDAGVMSLYRYVPGKAELLDLMLDAAHGEVPRPVPSGGGWRARLERVARQDRALYQRHPWLLQVATRSRPPLGPQLIAKYDDDLRAVEGIGLSDVEMDAVVTLVSDFVLGAARGAVEAAQAAAHTGMTDEQWWAAHAPVLERVFDPARYPLAARVGAAAGAAQNAAYDPRAAFEFGLARVLDGIAVLVDSRSAG